MELPKEDQQLMKEAVDEVNRSLFHWFFGIIAVLALVGGLVYFYITAPCESLDYLPQGLLPHRCSQEVLQQKALEKMLRESTYPQAFPSFKP
jgi:hypothetical protein